MRRSAGGLVLVGIVTALAAAACEVDSINGNVDLPDGGGGVALPDGSTSGIDSGAASGDWNGGGDGDAGGDAGADVDAGPQGPLPFTPSNIALDGVDVSNVGAWVVDQPNCALDTMAKTVGAAIRARSSSRRSRRAMAARSVCTSRARSGSRRAVA